MTYNKIYQLSTPTCPPCNRAKALFSELAAENSDFEYVYINYFDGLPEGIVPYQNAVPMFFDENKEPIKMTYNELYNLVKEGVDGL